MRLFDTPGYGSIVREHEEVLMEFIPNSDVIIYTVNYKIRIQENDYVFLGFLKELIRSPKRIKELEEAFEGYTLDLLGKCENLIDKQYNNIKISNTQKEQIKKRTEELINNINSVIPDLIEPTFDNLIESIPKNLAIAKYNIEKKVLTSIDSVSTANMDETIYYVSNHLLPYSTSQETLEVKRYIEVKLEELNDEVSDYLNKEIMDFNKDIELTFSTATELAGKGISKKVGSKIVTGALSNYFIKFGGAGGAGAGDFFGKTFKRETHNVLIDYSTWKSKLKNKIGKVINEWYTDTLEAVRNDLKELKKQNIDTLKSIIEEETSKYDYDEEIKDEKEINKLIEELQIVKEKLGA